MPSAPLHLAATHVGGDKVFAVAQEHTVSNSVDVRGREIGDACVARVLAVARLCLAHHLAPHLRSHVITSQRHELIIVDVVHVDNQAFLS